MNYEEELTKLAKREEEDKENYPYGNRLGKRYAIKETLSAAGDGAILGGVLLGYPGSKVGKFVGNLTGVKYGGAIGSVAGAAIPAAVTAIGVAKGNQDFIRGRRALSYLPSEEQKALKNRLDKANENMARISERWEIANSIGTPNQKAYLNNKYDKAYDAAEKELKDAELAEEAAIKRGLKLMKKKASINNYEEMIKFAYEDIVDSFEKEAAARWRKEFGDLSEEAKSKLREGVASQANETAKRVRGQNTMMKDWNIQRNTTPLNLLDLSKPSAAKGKLQNWFYKKIGPAYVRFEDGAQMLLDRFGNNKDKPDFKGLKTVSRFGKKNLKRLYKTDRPLYDEIASIINHHEIGGEALISNKKAFNAAKGGRYFSHFSPEVLHRESAAVATASPKAQEFMKNMRSKKQFAILTGLSNDKTGYKPWQRVSELDELKRVGGIEYGKSAVIDKKKMRNHINAYK